MAIENTEPYASFSPDGNILQIDGKRAPDTFLDRLIVTLGESSSYYKIRYSQGGNEYWVYSKKLESDGSEADSSFRDYLIDALMDSSNVTVERMLAVAQTDLPWQEMVTEDAPDQEYEIVEKKEDQHMVTGRKVNKEQGFTGGKVEFTVPAEVKKFGWRDILEYQLYAQNPRAIVIKKGDDSIMYSGERFRQISTYPVREREEILDEIAAQAQSADSVSLIRIVFKDSS